MLVSCAAANSQNLKATTTITNHNHNHNRHRRAPNHSARPYRYHEAITPNRYSHYRGTIPYLKPWPQEHRDRHERSWYAPTPSLLAT